MKREAGQITVVLTNAGLMLVRGQPVEIPDDEFPQYTIATALTLRLRISAEHARVGGMPITGASTRRLPWICWGRP